MGCEKSKCEAPQPAQQLPATPAEQEACVLAQTQLELILNFQLRLDFVPVKPEDAISQASLISINGPGAARWFQLEKMEKLTQNPEADDGDQSPSRSQSPNMGGEQSQSTTRSTKEGDQSLARSIGSKSEKHDFLVSTGEGKSRFQIVYQHRSAGSRIKHMLLNINTNGDSVLMYSIASPNASVNNLSGQAVPLEIQAQSPGQELKQVLYVAGNSFHSFSLSQEGKSGCTVSREGQRGSSRCSATIEPGMNVVLYVGLICAALAAQDQHHGDLFSAEKKDSGMFRQRS